MSHGRHSRHGDIDNHHASHRGGIGHGGIGHRGIGLGGQIHTTGGFAHSHHHHSHRFGSHSSNSSRRKPHHRNYNGHSYQLTTFDMMQPNIAPPLAAVLTIPFSQFIPGFETQTILPTELVENNIISLEEVNQLLFELNEMIALNLPPTWIRSLFAVVSLAVWIGFTVSLFQIMSNGNSAGITGVIICFLLFMVTIPANVFIGKYYYSRFTDRINQFLNEENRDKPIAGYHW